MVNVLLIGGGGREHALTWKMVQSSKIGQLYIAPGNAGTGKIGINVTIDFNDMRAVKTFVLLHKIDMVIVGPEAPLVDGIHDRFLADDDLKLIPVIGPCKQGAMLEGSKDFANAFMKKYGIPTADYKTFTKDTLSDGLLYLASKNPPYVLKADGLAAGKGVLILNELEEAQSELKAMLEEAKFGSASRKVIIEDFLDGIELSVFVLTDGKSYVILPEAKDYKRIGEGDTGLNTGGMGSISPVAFADKSFMQKIERKIIKPTIEGLRKEKIEYKGFIFFGLIKVKDEPYVIEYNVRMGDPEAESVIPRIKSDIMDLFTGIAEGTLAQKTIDIDPRHTAAVFLVSGGYPEAYEKGYVINGLDQVDDCILFHAGTKSEEPNGEVKTNGGRVLAVCSYGENMEEALKTAYKNAEKIHFKDIYYRKDLGFDLNA
ncbi:MAG: phosphoribosylamine--glycine ligase [Bacteroidetes bacterium]|nr:phosphoribosylamine--glycine ligase [Bacteroidota bacterium]